jgi:hypothetical protein
LVAELSLRRALSGDLWPRPIAVKSFLGLTQIQHAIVELPAEDQTALAAWIAERDRTRWDEEIERDFSPGGAGMELLERVKQQVRDGLSQPLSEGRPRQ